MPRPPLFLVLGATMGLLALGIEWTYPGENAFWLALAASCAMLLVALLQRGVSSDAGARTPETASAERPSPPQLDVLAIRIALPAAVAAPLASELRRTLSSLEPDRLGRAAALLLAAQEQWRFTALDATRPLEIGKADKLFSAWCQDVRRRYVGGTEGTDDFRSSALTVLCLHAQTQEEVPDVVPTDADAVYRTLMFLARGPRTVGKLEVWSSPGSLSPGDIAELDRAMLAVTPR